MATASGIQMPSLLRLEKSLRSYPKAVRTELSKTLNLIGEKWKTEAQRRVPVDTGLTRNTIIKEPVNTKDGELSIAVGSNQLHSNYIEFGTKRIAGGAVKNLGTSPAITDADAIKDWPALQDRGGSGQQMPWLRPAANAILDDAIRAMGEAMVRGEAAAALQP